METLWRGTHLAHRLHLGCSRLCGVASGPCCSAEHSAISLLKLGNPLFVLKLLFFFPSAQHERNILILYKAKGDITEREGGWKQSLLSAEADLFCSVFCLDLMLSWLFPATRQGMKYGNAFPAFGQVSQSVLGVTFPCLFSSLCN